MIMASRLAVEHVASVPTRQQTQPVPWLDTVLLFSQMLPQSVLLLVEFSGNRHLLLDASTT